MTVLHPAGGHCALKFKLNSSSMKKLLVSLTMAACCLLPTVVLNSCANEDNPVQTQELIKSKLVGKWTVYYVEEGYDQDMVGTEWWYDADGSFTNVQGEHYTGTGTYEWDGDLLVMIINNMPWSAQVKEITDTEMIWYGPLTGKTIKLKRQIPVN